MLPICASIRALRGFKSFAPATHILHHQGLVRYESAVAASALLTSLSPHAANGDNSPLVANIGTAGALNFLWGPALRSIIDTTITTKETSNTAYKSLLKALAGTDSL